MKSKVYWVDLCPGYIAVIVIFVLATLLGDRAVTTFKENSPLVNRKCVIIDAGHGGVDGGATSCTGILESKINLEIALKLNDVFHLLGIKTVMIRDTDRSVYTEGESIAAKKVSDLKNRVKTVNETPNAILLSIHQNYYGDGRYSGAQTFYANNEGSKALAQKLQTAFLETINKGSNRKAKKASGIYLMDRIDCVGVLVECGFLSNLKEEQVLRDPAYQKKVCCILASVCSEYLCSTTS